MRFWLLLTLVVIPMASLADDTADIQSLSATGGEISLTFYRGNLRDLGLRLEGAEAQDFQYDSKSLGIQDDGGINFLADAGHFTQLQDGFLPLEAGLAIVGDGFRLESGQLRLVPKTQTRDTFLLADEDGVSWFYLDYGHYERDGLWLYARFLDMRITTALADQLGDMTLVGQIVGYATVRTEIEEPQGAPLGTGAQCPVENPNWPTVDGYDVDVAMLKLPIVSQVAREGGRVAITPSAYFENIGNADIPWFAQFADTRGVDACCVDEGEGLCAPYGNDQGGLLVYALYRFFDGRLEQLGQSDAKHAFNSVNTDTDDGSLPCRAANRAGRLVPAGCEDLYQAGTNAHQAFLGPREEIIAHQVIWLRPGSIWDQTGPGGVPDGHCDYMPDNQVYGGQIPCAAPVADVMDRRLSVPEDDLAIPGARYFIEAWYLARDDINTINSFGRKEITPVFTTIWSFPEAAPFQQGPVILEFPALQQGSSKQLFENVESDEGQLQVASSVTRLGEKLWQYDVSLMNLDFDRAVDGFDIPLPKGANISSTAFFDGDSDAANDWLATINADTLSFEAPQGVSLKWGTLVSFRFVADNRPTESTATLSVAGAGSPESLTVNTFTALDVLFENGFEQSDGS